MDPSRHLEILVLRCQIGDDDAFDELFALYQPKLRYYMHRLASNQGNVEDMLQDVWLLVYRKIEKLKDPKAFGVWVYKIARNRVFKGFQSKRVFASLPDEVGEEVKEVDVTGYDGGAIHEGLSKIGKQHREVLTLFFLEQMSYKDIAKVVGCGVGTVRSRLYYAKQSLRKVLESKNER